MKRFVLVSTVISAALVLNSTVFAAEPVKQQPKAATTAPAVEQNKEKRTIFNFRNELGLTDKQVEAMKALVNKLQEGIKEKTKNLEVLRKELVTMIQNRDKLAAIKSKIQNLANIQADISYFDIEISRKIEDVLTAQQLKKWKDIQKIVRDQIGKDNKPK